MFDSISWVSSGSGTAVVFDAALKGFVYLLVLWGILRLALRSATASVRYTTCVLAAMGLLILPLVSALVPQWRIPLPPAVTEIVNDRLERTIETFSLDSRDENPVEKAVERQVASPSPPGPVFEPATSLPGGRENVGEDRMVRQPAPLAPMSSFTQENSNDVLTVVAGSNTDRSESSEGFSRVEEVTAVPYDGTQAVSETVGSSGSLRGWRDRLPAVPALILEIWGGVAFLCFLPWVVGLIALGRLLRRSRRVETGPWFRKLDEICRAMAIELPHLYQTDLCIAPMAGSFLQVFIIVPSDAKLWPEAKMRNVLIHELGHIKRRDDLTYLPVRLVAALHWFNPFAWSLLKMLRFERERACDDFVLSQGVASCDYASHLLEIVKRSPSTHPAMLAGTPMATPRRLEKRILAILDDKINRKGLTMKNLISATVATVVVTLMIGAASVTVTEISAAPETPSGTASEKKEPLTPAVLTASAQEEVERYYKAAPKEVTDFVVWTEGQFKGTQWLPENAIDNMDVKARESSIQQYVAILNEKPYNREICRALVMASVLRDKRFLPGLLKTAAYDELCDYDCCPKWMAVAALARMGDESAVPVLVPLVDHGNLNTRMWARAVLVRLTGQTFDQDKKAWGDWWNAQNKEPKLKEEDLKPWVHIKTRWRSETAGTSGMAANAQEEIERSYKDASQEVKDYILWTEKEWHWIQWLPENSVENMDAETREKAIVRYAKVLDEKSYGRELCPALNMASVLRDKRFLPGLLKTAAYHEPVDYDCCPKWMAVAALARMGEESAVPVLIPLVDHGNENTRMWARAALVRLTGQKFDQDKKAWGAWWNGQNKEPKLKDEDLKPWSMPTATQAVAQPAPTPGAGGYPGAGAGYPGMGAAYPQPAPTQPSGTPATPSAVPSSGLTANAQEEIERYYKAVPKEVTDFILKTEQMFRWPAENAFASMDAETREKEIQACEKTLNEVPYSRALCPALAKANVLRDKRLLPGLLKTAAYTNPSGNYDCRAKWMAVAALARMGDEAAVPVLVPLVDFGNTNVRMWSRAALYRLTGQTFDQDKKAWGAWWNAQNKEPKLKEEDLKPWVPLTGTRGNTLLQPPKEALVPAPGATKVFIPGKYETGKEWVSSKVEFSKGDILFVEAEGAASHSIGDGPFSPNGSLGNLGRRYVAAYGEHLCNDANQASLVGKVGEKGTSFFVGESRAIRAADAGVLYLGFNESYGTSENNSGSFTAYVSKGEAQTALQKCLKNQILIREAKAQWGVDNRKQSMDVPKWEDLIGPDKWLKEKPVCPNGGEYALGFVEPEVVCSKHPATRWVSASTPVAGAPTTPNSSGMTGSAQEEIDRYYKPVPKEVTDFILVTERQFGGNLWFPENFIDSLDAETREKEIRYYATVLNEKPYSRELCPALAKAGVLRDKRLLPGLLKVAGHTEASNYDCRPKWMAVAALARMGKDAQNLPAGKTVESRTVAEERLTVDNPEREETFRDCKVRLIRVSNAPSVEVELAVWTPQRTDTQQVNLKVNASQTIDSYEILCEEITVGGGKAGGSARILVRYKEPVEKALVQTPRAESSESREYEAAIPVLVPLVDFGNKNVQMWSRAALYRLTGQTFDQDKKAWGAWWNAQNKEPKLKEEDLKPWVPASDPRAQAPVSQ